MGPPVRRRKNKERQDCVASQVVAIWLLSRGAAVVPQRGRELILGAVFTSIVRLFQKLAKARLEPTVSHFQWFSTIKNLIFRSDFHRFFMFFQNRSREPFLEGPGADLSSTGRFWCHFRFSGFPKRHLWGAIFAQNVDLELPGGRPETVLGATLRRTTLQNRFFPTFLDLWTIWDRFLVDFALFPSFWERFLVFFASISRPSTPRHHGRP